MWWLLIYLAIFQGCFAPPVTKGKSGETDAQDGLEEHVEYHRYIKQVVKALESDPAFRQKLESASDADIRSGKIAHELELVSHHIRTRLDEIKRTELHRLKQLAARRNELMNNELNRDDPLHHHIDHGNPHTFEIEDLRKLIMKTTEDLADADRKRREEFKQYELQKEYEKMAKLNQTTGDERQKLEKEYKDMDQKHKQHEKLHSPGHKEHLKEVWEEQDHMTQDFNPKTFFMLHDLDSNGLWDQDEVKALFIKELDKMYAAGAPEDDMRERMEEMERMRESVFNEIDTNKDGFIDFHEFLEQTKRNNFDRDPGWKPLDEEPSFTDQELEEYVRTHNLQYDPNAHYNGNPQMYPPQQYPPGYHQGQMPPQGYHPDQMNAQGQHQMPPQGYHPDQMHAQGQQQMPPQGYHPGQMPPQAYPQGQQHQGQFHPGQLPQSQVHPQPIPNVEAGNQQQLNTNEIYANPQHPQMPKDQFQVGNKPIAPMQNAQQPINPPHFQVKQQFAEKKSQEIPQPPPKQQSHPNNMPRNAPQAPQMPKQPQQLQQDNSVDNNIIHKQNAPEK